jgi:hypothetical protein
MVLGDDALRMFGKGSIPMQHGGENTGFIQLKKVNKQQGWVGGRTFVRLVHLGTVSGGELLNVRLDVPRALSRWSHE